MDAAERFTFYLGEMVKTCHPFHCRAAELLDVEPQDPILAEMVMRAYFAGWEAAVRETDAQAIEQGVRWPFVLDVQLPPGRLVDGP